MLLSVRWCFLYINGTGCMQEDSEKSGARHIA